MLYEVATDPACSANDKKASQYRIFNFKAINKEN